MGHAFKPPPPFFVAEIDAGAPLVALTAGKRRGLLPTGTMRLSLVVVPCALAGFHQPRDDRHRGPRGRQNDGTVADARCWVWEWLVEHRVREGKERAVLPIKRMGFVICRGGNRVWHCMPHPQAYAWRRRTGPLGIDRTRRAPRAQKSCHGCQLSCALLIYAMDADAANQPNTQRDAARFALSPLVHSSRLVCPSLSLPACLSVPLSLLSSQQYPAGPRVATRRNWCD